MKNKHTRAMSSKQWQKLQSMLKGGIPKLSFVEAESAIIAVGTLLQGVYAAFEPFLRKHRGQPIAMQDTVPIGSFVLDVPYCGAKTIQHLLQVGNYDWENADVSDQHFPQRRIGKRRIILRLVSFKHVISTKDVLARFKRRGLRPANPAELLALGAKYPQLQQQFPIIALGQRWPLPNGDELVTCLAWHSMLRRVHLLCQFRRDWPAHCRFAAVVVNGKRQELRT